MLLLLLFIYFVNKCKVVTNLLHIVMCIQVEKIIEKEKNVGLGLLALETNLNMSLQLL